MYFFLKHTFGGSFVVFLLFFFLQSTERFLRYRTADTHTHAHKVETPKQGKTGQRRFPFQNVQR